MQRTEQKTVDGVTDILCDICGTSVVPSALRAHQDNLDEFIDYGVLQASFGYGSAQDGTSVHVDLCEPCFMQLNEHVAVLKSAHEKSKGHP
ncbi:MAG: hypothetical protein LAT53_07295 [Idiomarina sp.]|nr:hypothetical protein [Idiomarina sp.]